MLIVLNQHNTAHLPFKKEFILLDCLGFLSNCFSLIVCLVLILSVFIRKKFLSLYLCYFPCIRSIPFLFLSPHLPPFLLPPILPTISDMLNFSIADWLNHTKCEPVTHQIGRCLNITRQTWSFRIDYKV